MATCVNPYLRHILDTYVPKVYQSHLPPRRLVLMFHNIAGNRIHFLVLQIPPESFRLIP